MIRNAPAHPAKDHEGIGTKLESILIHSIEIINTVSFYVLVGIGGTAIGVGILAGLLLLLGVHV